MDIPNTSAILSHRSRKYFLVAFANDILFVMALMPLGHACAMFFKYCDACILAEELFELCLVIPN